MPNIDIKKIKEPFTFTELKKMSTGVTRKDLSLLIDEGKLQVKKIGRIDIYWNIYPESTVSSGLESLTKRLEFEIKELKQELMAERQKVRQLSIQDGIDEPWKEAAMAMARILSEQKQISMQEVLEYFNAPLDD